MVELEREPEILTSIDSSMQALSAVHYTALLLAPFVPRFDDVLDIASQVRLEDEAQEGGE
jgi:hypothetical protein